MSPLYLTYLNSLDVAALALSDDEILAAVEQGLAAQGRGETVIEPRMHLVPDKTVPGHFNILRGAFRAPIAVTAPVRMSVSPAASMIATGCPVCGSNRLRRPISDGRSCL